jgi:hypothetical protein
MASQTILKMLQPKGRTVHVGAQAGPDGAMKQLRQYLIADGMLFGNNDIWHGSLRFRDQQHHGPLFQSAHETKPRIHLYQ